MNQDELTALLATVLPSEDLLCPRSVAQCTLEGIPFTFTTVPQYDTFGHTRRRADSDLVVTAEWKSPLHLGLTLGTENATGPRSRDGYAFGGDDPNVAAALMTPAMCEALDEVGSGVRWSADDTQLTMQRSAGIDVTSGTAALDVFAMAAVVALVNAGRKKLPDPSALAAHCTAARTFVHGTPFEFAHNPLTIHREEPAYALSVGVQRIGPHAYTFEGTLRFRAPIATHFSVTSNRDAAVTKRLWSHLSGGDPQLGDAAFDDAFFVESASGADLSTRVGPDVRAAMLALLSVGRHVKLDEGALHVGPAPVTPLQPDQLVQTAAHLARVGDLLTASAPAAPNR